MAEDASSTRTTRPQFSGRALLAAVPAMVKAYRSNRAQLRTQAAGYDDPASSRVPFFALVPDMGYVPEDDLSPWREGEKTPVVCIHGTMGSPPNWAEFSATVQDRRLFFADYGIHGTAPLETCVEDAVHYVVGLATRVGMPELTLLGHSRGGLVALLVASDPRVRDVVRIRRVIGIGGNFSGVPRWKVFPTQAELEALAPSDTDLTRTVDTLVRRMVDPGKYRAAFYRAFGSFAYRTVGAASQDQFSDSPELVEMLQRVDPTVEVVSISSLDDRVVPPETAFSVNVAPEKLTRILVQNEFPDAVVIHNLLPRDPHVIALIERYL